MFYISKNLVVFFLFIIMFAIQNSIQDFITQIDFSTHADLYLPYLIFLPHGIRIISLIVYGNIIIPGLILAHLLTLILRMESMQEFFSFKFDILITFGSPLLSIGSVWLAIFLIAKKIKVDENEINVPFILKITFLSALLNAFSSNIFRYVFQESYTGLNINILLYFVGDALGALVLFSFLALINRSFRNN